MIPRLLPCIAFLTLAGAIGCNRSGPHRSGTAASQERTDSHLWRKFAHSELKTNWSLSLIPLDSIHPGGPPKNGIPAIDFPEFLSAQQAKAMLLPTDMGVFVNYGNEQKFYPLRILNWHEIVNDVVGGLPVAVTFCPLCGSAITFSRVVDNDTLTFGVSGRLFESNLLMFDDQTESLWLQASGRCVVGDHLGKRLQHINTNLLTFEELLTMYPAASVLSMNTGYHRNYAANPYVDYDQHEELYFPVSRTDRRFANKEMVYVVVLDTVSTAFLWRALLQQGTARLVTPFGTVRVAVSNNIPVAVEESTGRSLPGYFSYWFSWYTVAAPRTFVWPQ